VNQFINVYDKLFNVIFDNGIMPSIWLIWMIKPIYKNKGDKFDPKNYRPITIVSCLGKLVIAILNERLNAFSESFSVISENQYGFRQGYSTSDNLFTLQSFIEILKCKKKRMYCAFIDFIKAFDTVWRAGFWHKMLLNNINGKMYDVIFNMYCNIKSCIVFNNCKSDYFACDNGVRQGDNLLPFLFSLFSNVLETFIQAKHVTDLESISSDLENQLDIYLKLFIILYTDDTVILSESESDLQAQLDAFYEYCLTWKLKVNVDKTKIVIFGSGRTPRNLSFKYNGSEIEVVKSFNYLGIIFNKTGSFNLGKQRLVDKAVVSMYEVLKLGRKHNLPIECLLRLFDKMVKPNLLYGCEIWGFGNNDTLRKSTLRII
jgi:sorting nexin-29